jgi:hypothetical protein
MRYIFLAGFMLIASSAISQEITFQSKSKIAFKENALVISEFHVSDANALVLKAWQEQLKPYEAEIRFEYIPKAAPYQYLCRLAFIPEVDEAYVAKILTFLGISQVMVEETKLDVSALTGINNNQ